MAKLLILAKMITRPQTFVRKPTRYLFYRKQNKASARTQNCTEVNNVKIPPHITKLTKQKFVSSNFCSYSLFSLKID